MLRINEEMTEERLRTETAKTVDQATGPFCHEDLTLDFGVAFL